ncbi:DUF3298 domain-containing protein [Paenibacillus sp. JSM ZJ436]|uniref:DUF3298 and DUF4163 domain-containing protein n=1 Tax=Paenibacillus sp. JSM ZJ436 TaxID=3376190 RepID=UPI0037A1F53D
MKKLVSLTLLFCLMLSISLPSWTAEAATKVKTSVHTYKGQQYVQVSGIDAKIAERINKALKVHAVIAAKHDREQKSESKSYWFQTMASTKYNNNGLISVVYTNDVNTGGVHSLYFSTTYNFDISTGNRIMLNNVAGSDQRIYNLHGGISHALSAMYHKGRNIFEESIDEYPLSNDTSFYFYNEGIVIRFNPYDVGPFSEGFVDVKIPTAVLDTPNQYSTHASPGQNVIESKIDDDFEGYDEDNLYVLSNGQIWKQVEYKYDYHYSYRPDVIIYKDGSSYYMQVEDMDDRVKVERIK